MAPVNLSKIRVSLRRVLSRSDPANKADVVIWEAEAKEEEPVAKAEHPKSMPVLVSHSPASDIQHLN
jgi:hypothetical protein